MVVAVTVIAVVISVLVIVLVMFVGSMSVPAEDVVVSVALARELPHGVVKSEEDQRTTRNPGEEISNSVADGDSTPGDKKAQHRCEQHMSAAGNCRDSQRLGPAPSLRAGREHERQPVRRNCRV